MAESFCGSPLGWWQAVLLGSPFWVLWSQWTCALMHVRETIPATYHKQIFRMSGVRASAGLRKLNKPKHTSYFESRKHSIFLLASVFHWKVVGNSFAQPSRKCCDDSMLAANTLSRQVWSWWMTRHFCLQLFQPPLSALQQQPTMHW